MWLPAAILSAVFAGLTSILAKCGIRKTDSDLATALRTGVVLLFSWLMVLVVGSAQTIATISPESFLFLGLSGLATGLSWICYFKALSLADVNKVVPIDKSGTIISVLLAIFLFGENAHLPVKLAGTALIGGGILMMTVSRQQKTTEAGPGKLRWLPYAVLSAVFASLTSILAKIGIENVESNLGTALRTCVVLLIAWAIVFARRKHTGLRHIDKKELLFIVLSGFATGGSWLCYYYAIQKGRVSVVVPIDKLSIVVTMLFSFVFLKEKFTKRTLIGLLLMVVGTLALAL